MRILLCTYLFPPSVGGIEAMSQMLAEEFTAQGHEVRVITPTPSPEADQTPYEVHRQPSLGRVWADYRWCDVFLHNNISLSFAWPVWLRPKPWVVSHQTWIARADGRVTWRDRLKRVCLRRAAGISISQAIADSLREPSVVIANCYNHEVFHEDPAITRDRELVFVGRLVSDKGADLLVTALGQLARRGLRPGLTIVGDGPERAKLVAQVAAEGLEAQVRFTGALRGVKLADELRRHRIQVVPSRWAEPFGIVALEGVGCGCIVVGSAKGGLAGAIGACGVTFPNGDAPALTAALESLLRDPAADARFAPHRPAHREAHQRASVARRYLEVLQAAHSRR